MIKANELRIGNLVFKEGVIHPIGFYDFENSGSNFMIDEYKPIPLTEELLFKCGFEWREDIQQGKAIALELPQRRKLSYYDGDINCLSLYQDEDCIDFAYASHTDTHQLQNLYFTLIGEELKIEI